MNYKSKPDIDLQQPLTPDAVCLFQRFRQEADCATLDTLLEAEVEQHLKRCELAILYFASCAHYWCELPAHPIQDVKTWAFHDLEKRGFEIQHHSVGIRRKVRDHHNREREIEAVEIRSYTTASWLKIAPSEQRAQEWLRREGLEDAERAKNPPMPSSTLSDGKIVESKAVWAGLLDEKFLVEVQHTHERYFLCVFEVSGKCLHCERTSVSFGAVFGPDVGDIEAWQQRAIEIIAAQGGCV